MKLRKPCNCSALIKAIDAYIAKADDDIEDNLKKAGFAVPKKTVRRMKEIEDELTELLEEDNKVILNTINDYDDLKDFINESWPELQDSQDLVEKLTRTFDRQFSEAVPEYAAEYLKRIESDAVLEAVSLTHQTTSWISSWSEELAHIMKLNDNSVIQNILNNGLRNGDSVQEVSAKIADSGIRDPGYRSRRVATTELLRAHSVAQQESFMQSPAVESKMWRHSGWRQYARENHMAIDGQTVKKDEPFELAGADGGTYYPMYPRDSELPAGESINCGCIAVPIVSEDVLGLSLEERNRLRDEALAEIDEDFDRKLDEQNMKLGLRDENGTSQGIGLSSNSSAGGSSVPRHPEPELMEKLDDTSSDAVKSKIEEYEKDIVNSPIENAVVVTKDGEVWKCQGDLNHVYPDADLGEKFRGSSATHNHPIGSDNEHSFSQGDASKFVEYELESLRGIDEKYVYELKRNSSDIDKPRDLWEIPVGDTRHEQMIIWAQRNGVGYRRWEHD